MTNTPLEGALVVFCFDIKKYDNAAIVRKLKTIRIIQYL
jgi:hypothetical protein